MTTNAMPHDPSTPRLVSVEDMKYEDFTWLVENGIDPFDTPEQREADARKRLTELYRQAG